MVILCNVLRRGHHPATLIAADATALQSLGLSGHADCIHTLFDLAGHQHNHRSAARCGDRGGNYSGRAAGVFLLEEAKKMIKGILMMAGIALFIFIFVIIPELLRCKRERQAR